MNINRHILILIALAITSCNSLLEEQLVGESLVGETQGISICVSQAQTRTTINSDDMASVDWLSDDCIYLWAKEEGAESYSFAQAEFKQKYYFSSYSDAVFTALIDSMSEGNYSYFGVYPKPTTTDGSVVHFALGSEQSGIYDGAMDIMVASPTQGGALSLSPNEDVTLSFVHLTHALRINIPEGRNLFGRGIKRLEVTFPQDVVGNFSFDAALSDPTTTLSSGESMVTLCFDEELEEGEQYAWLFISPGELSGTLSFRAYDNSNYCSDEISVTINKTMVAGRITPITLTIPAAISATTLKIEVEENNLGEEIESITISAPSGALFTDGSSAVTLPYSSTNEYSVGYYTEEYGDLFRAGSLSISFESKSTIVSGGSISLSGVVADEVNSFVCNVPYLFTENFDEVSETGTYDYFSDQALPGLSYWSGDVYAYWSGRSVAVRAYKFIGVSNGYLSLDLDGLINLKSDQVTLTVNFYADWGEANKCGAMNLILYNDTGGGQTIEMESNSSASSSNVLTEHNIDLEYCNSQSVITWESDGSDTSFGTGYDYIYLDNITIQIKETIKTEE